MTYYKLTDADCCTYGGMKWEVGKENKATGGGKKLCSDGYIHVYDTPEQAAFMKPAHVSSYTRLWEVRSPNRGITDGTKRGVKRAILVREIALPEISMEQRIEIAIRVSLLVYKYKGYKAWAKNWLSGKDRTSSAAADAAYGAYSADAAADAAHACAYGAFAHATDAAHAAYAAYSAHVDAVYADAAHASAEACARAADAAAKPIPLCKIIASVLKRNKEEA